MPGTLRERGCLVGSYFTANRFRSSWMVGSTFHTPVGWTLGKYTLCLNASSGVSTETGMYVPLRNGTFLLLRFPNGRSSTGSFTNRSSVD